LLLQATTAVADTFLYPGSMCVKWNDREPQPVLNASRIYNHSGRAEMHVDCPIIHTNFNARSGNRLYDADIGVIDHSRARYVTCWLSNVYQVGSRVFGGTGGTRNTSRYAPTPNEINLDYAPTGRHPQNWYYFGCSIPRAEGGARSGITFYSASQ